MFVSNAFVEPVDINDWLREALVEQKATSQDFTQPSAVLASPRA